MYQSGIEWILGLQRRGNRLYLNPCVPAQWNSFQVRYRFGRTVYHLVFSGSEEAVTEQSDSRLQAGPDTFIELKDDGEERRFTVLL
ncbi:hypothetical protein D3C73_1556700 [compost metagenome]